MVFVAGPRQIGKATLARGLPAAGDSHLNWDIADHRARTRGGHLPRAKLRVFDEINTRDGIGFAPARALLQRLV
jgi:hypothetical protein